MSIEISLKRGDEYIDKAAKAEAGEVDAVFYSIKPSKIMSKWVGESEQNVKKLFQAARGNNRSVIFIDESRHSYQNAGVQVQP